METIPFVIEKNAEGERGYDIYSRLLRERIIFLTGEVSDRSADLIVAQMIYLAHSDPINDIYFYINSPGGSVSAGLAIFDTMTFVKPDVCTICTGLAASMGAMLLAAGTKGKRMAMPNARVLIHQPMGGARGDAANIQIHAKEIIKTKQHLNELLAGFTGRSMEEIEAATDRDKWFSSEEAKNFGLIDRVVTNMSDLQG